MYIYDFVFFTTNLKSTLISKEISRAEHEYVNTPSLRHNLSASFAHGDITKQIMHDNYTHVFPLK